jgi:ferredoxin-NADP reductase
MQPGFLSVQIRQIRHESAGVASFELDAPDGAPLPGYAPGAHIDVRVPGGAVRSYSLLDPPAEGGCYRIAVKREGESRGGSRWFHEQARVGMPLEIAPPANAFALVPDATASVFIAGGIGITPLLSMIGRLVELGRPWELHYAAASRAAMPFQALLASYVARGRGRLVTHFSDAGGGRMDIAAIIAAAPAKAHLYCCGPVGMIDAFVEAGRARAPETVHYERFAAAQAAATEGGFTLKLARDGRCLPVPAGKSILDVLLDAGVDVPYSCTQGVCGTCRVRVLEGEPEHRDDYLSDPEKAANDAILVCCSGSRTARLELDL